MDDDRESDLRVGRTATEGSTRGCAGSCMGGRGHGGSDAERCEEGDEGERRGGWCAGEAMERVKRRCKDWKSSVFDFRQCTCQHPVNDIQDHIDVLHRPRRYEVCVLWAAAGIAIHTDVLLELLPLARVPSPSSQLYLALSTHSSPSLTTDCHTFVSCTRFDCARDNDPQP